MNRDNNYTIKNYYSKSITCITILVWAFLTIGKLTNIIVTMALIGYLALMVKSTYEKLITSDKSYKNKYLIAVLIALVAALRLSFFTSYVGALMAISFYIGAVGCGLLISTGMKGCTFRSLDSISEYMYDSLGASIDEFKRFVLATIKPSRLMFGIVSGIIIVLFIMIIFSFGDEALFSVNMLPDDLLLIQFYYLILSLLIGIAASIALYPLYCKRSTEEAQILIDETSTMIDDTPYLGVISTLLIFNILFTLYRIYKEPVSLEMDSYIMWYIYIVFCMIVLIRSTRVYHMNIDRKSLSLDILFRLYSVALLLNSVVVLYTLYSDVLEQDLSSMITWLFVVCVFTLTITMLIITFNIFARRNGTQGICKTISVLILLTIIIPFEYIGISQYDSYSSFETPCNSSKTVINEMIILNAEAVPMLYRLDSNGYIEETQKRVVRAKLLDALCFKVDFEDELIYQEDFLALVDTKWKYTNYSRYRAIEKLKVIKFE